MNLLLITPEDLLGEGATARISGRRAAHLREVLGVEVGATVEAGLLGGKMGRATVTSTDGDGITVELDLDRDPPPRLDVRLVLSLPRPKSLRRILQGCAAVGLRSLHLINSWRVEKSYWSSPLLTESGLRRELILGAEQGRDTTLPELHLRRLFKPFVEDELPGIAGAEPGMLRLVGDVRADATCPAAVSRPVTLAIGPEGGLIPYEIEMLEAAGFAAVRIGERALRVEQAVAAFLGRLIP